MVKNRHRLIVSLLPPQPNEVPEPLLEQLAYGGRLVMPVGMNRDHQKIVIIDRTDKGFEREETIAVRFVPLISASEEE